MTTTQNKKPSLATANGRVWRWVALILLVWAALFLRLHALDQLPPGLYHDEAYYGLDAQHLLHGGPWAIFFTGNNGREPLHIYLLAGAMALLGERVWALRLVSALVGVLSIPLMYQLGRALLRGSAAPAGWAGVLAAAVLTVTYWHVNFSRVVFRAIDLVPLSLLATWLLVAGARRSSRRLFVLSGVALGLCLYTYLAARLLPLVVAGLAAAQFALAWRRGGVRAALQRPLVRGGLVALVAAGLVAAPLGAYFVTHPHTFGQRSGSLSILAAQPEVPGERPITLADNLAATVRMFVDRGDHQARHNLPHRPASDALGLIGFWVGLAAAAWSWREPRSQLLLLWLGIMLLPTTLSVEAPHFLRAIGALPAVCLLISDGLAHLAGRLTRLRPRLSPALWPTLAAAVTFISGGITYRDYFVRLPAEPTLGESFQVHVVRAAERALALSPTHDVALPITLYQEPTALFLLEPIFHNLQPIDNQPALERPAVLLPDQSGTLTGLVVLRQASGQPPVALVTKPVDPDTAAALLALPRMSPAGIPEIANVKGYLPRTAAPEQSLDVTFGERFRLRGYDLAPEPVRTGAPLRLTLYWESLRWAPEDYIVSLQLQTPAQDKLAQLDVQPGGGHYNTTLWRPGNIFVDTYSLLVPADLQPGLYSLMLGLYTPGTLQLLPSSTAAGASDGSVRVSALAVPDPALDLATIPAQPSFNAGDPALLRLRGYERGPAVPGSDLTLTFFWEALAPMAEDYTLFIHVQDESGAVHAQLDIPPLSGRAPTSWWTPGQIFRDEQHFRLPAEMPPGRYTVAIGMYYWATGQRLPLFTADGARIIDDRWLLPDLITLPEEMP